MPGSSGRPADGNAMLMRLSVPAEGGLRAVVADVAAKIAEYLGTRVPAADSLQSALEGLARRVGTSDTEDITFEFREVDRELVILALCEGRTSEVRYPLPA